VVEGRKVRHGTEAGMERYNLVVLGDVYPTLAEANRAIGDASVLARLTPARKRVLARVFAWLRR
jgi:hypothetical protein